VSGDVNLTNLSKGNKRYYAVTLDGVIAKTLFKDEMLIPTRSLAVAMAEEWEMQTNKIDLRTLKLNSMFAKAARL
jgi:chaperone required for assembly of F1-ATPase